MRAEEDPNTTPSTESTSDERTAGHRADSMQYSRHVARTLAEDAWLITDAEGQHTARIIGTEQDAIDRAHDQLAAYGGGHVLLTDAD
ncbi:hypothetical protein [Saccharopolyspora tripterygii]